MTPASPWRGYLKLSVVTCPVSMAPMSSESDILRFQGFGDEVDEALLSETIDSLIPRAFHTIDIRVFAPAAVTSCMWFEAPYFLLPDDDLGMEAYKVIRDAMRATGMVGLSWLTLCHRNHPVVIEPRETGVALWPLNEIGEACGESGLRDLPKSIPDPNFKARLDRLIAESIRNWSPEQGTPPIRERLFDLASARKKAQRRPLHRPPNSTAEVIILADANRPSSKH